MALEGSTKRRIFLPLKLVYFFVSELKLYNFHSKSPQQVVLERDQKQQADVNCEKQDLILSRLILTD